MQKQILELQNGAEGLQIGAKITNHKKKLKVGVGYPKRGRDYQSV